MNAPFRPPETPTDALARREHAKQDARNRWWSEYARINEALQAELDAIDRKYRERGFR